MTHLPPPGHRPGRKGHKVLERLAASEAPLWMLREAAGLDPLSAAGRKFERLIWAMAADGLLRKAGDVYLITRKGRLALDELRAGLAFVSRPQAVPAPSVRVFVNRVAA